MDPAVLVARLRRGEPAARAELFDGYSAGVYRVLVRMIGRADPESSDLLHDTFLRALDQIDTLRNPAALKSWLKGIAVFAAQEWLRARRRMGHPQAPETAAERSGAAPTPEAREAVREFYNLMDKLPEDERIAFVLRFIEGMELTEVAAACKVSLSTARRRIGRAEGLFREMIPEYPALHERLQGNVDLSSREVAPDVQPRNPDRTGPGR